MKNLSNFRHKTRFVATTLTALLINVVCTVPSPEPEHDRGYCRHYRTLNQTCNVLGHDFLNPELHEFYCSCEKGLECRGQRIHESNGTIIHENPKCQQTEE
ncbi:hypothetical protein CHS0354_002471 [Potamilus streckersoni]|uniref:Plethodontid modulating factor n=1 Tax=Potamilus streckersoni TaxID=2493646 RepID=A0AAE0W997_9BIVA|nr:hypothetical protein CHS0354_002471 [Potamilus streckersoni]